MVSIWFRNLAVRRKIALVIGVFSLMMLVSLGISLRELMAAEERARSIYREDLLPTTDLALVRINNFNGMYQLYKHIGATSEEMEALGANIAKSDAAGDEAWARYEKSFITDVQKEFGPKYRALGLEQRRIRNELVVPAFRKGQVDLGLRIIREKIYPLDLQLPVMGGKVIQEGIKHTNEALKAGDTSSRRGMILALVVALVGIALGGSVGWALVRGVDDPLRTFGGVLGHLAEGDLTVQADMGDRKDEFGTLGKAINTTMDKLRQLLRGVQEGVEGMASGSTQLSASADEMAVTSTEIARVAENMRSGGERMAAAVTELSASIEEVNLGTQASLGRLEEAVRATVQGEKAGLTTQNAMGEIAGTAGRISAAVGVIREIANQTNLLSLNAAIEAAKAGEHGKGFSVVAEEVRKLAERSGSSAKEIDSLLAAATAAVSQGEMTVATTVEILKTIRAGLDVFASQMQAMASAAVEQSAAGSDVARQVETSAQESTTVASAIVQMSASTNEVARTASQLHLLSEGLQAQVRHFKL